MENNTPEERVATVKSLRYMSTLLIVGFVDRAGNRFSLIGDRRMTSPISEFVEEPVRLFITDQTNWSWQPIDDLELKDEEDEL